MQPPTRREFLAAAGAFAATAGTGWLFRLVAAQPAARAAPAAAAAICKDAWGAAPVGAGFVAHAVERITVHHTAAMLADNRDAPRRLRGHQRFHRNAGWPDLAYHFVIDAHGHVYEGRPVAYRGDTFTEYDPTGHLLVACEGHFDRQPLPAAQLASLTDVLAWGVERFGVGVDTIGGHRDYTSTTCPGAAVRPLLADGTIGAGVEQRLRAGGVELAPFCGPAAADLVAAIEAGSDEPGAALTPARFLLRHSNTPGTADQEIPFGRAGWVPVAGSFGEGS